MAYEEDMSDWERDLRRLLSQEEQTPGEIPSSGQKGSPRYAPFATREEAFQELDELQARRDAWAILPRVQRMDAANQAARDLGLPLFFTYTGVLSPSGYRRIPGTLEQARADTGQEDAGDILEGMESDLLDRLGLHPPAALAAKTTALPWEKAQGSGSWSSSGGGSPMLYPYDAMDAQGNAVYGPDGDIEVGLGEKPAEHTPNYSPAPAATVTPAPTTTPAPTPTQSPPKYTINLALNKGYLNNQSAYPGADEWTLMPLAYLMQAQAVMVREEYPYAADQTISGREEDKRSECVGMIRLPGNSWYRPPKKKDGKIIEKEYPILWTTVGGTYRNSTHKGELTDDTEKFDGMQLITEGYTHIVTYYKEFFDGEKMQYNVIVHNAGKKYREIDRENMTPEEIADAEKYNLGVDKYNKENDKHAEVIPIDEAIEKYDLEFMYWCAPNYIDYGDQRDPDTGELLTPKRKWK